MRITKSYLYTHLQSNFLKSFLIFISLIAVIFGINYKSNDFSSSWVEELEYENEILEKNLFDENTLEQLNVEYDNQIKKNKAYIEVNKNPDSNNLWEFVYKQLDLLFILTLFLCVYIILYQKNQRDFLNIIKPKALFFGRLYSYLFLYSILTFIFISLCIVIGIFLWPESLFESSYFYIESDSIEVSSYFIDSILKTSLVCITSFIFISVTHIIHSIFNNSLTYIILLFFFIGGSYLETEIGILNSLSFFQNLNLLPYINNLTVKFNGLYIYETIILLIIYTALMVSVGYYIFKIKNKISEN